MNKDSVLEFPCLENDWRSAADVCWAEICSIGGPVFRGLLKWGSVEVGWIVSSRVDKRWRTKYNQSVAWEPPACVVARGNPSRPK